MVHKFLQHQKHSKHLTSPVGLCLEVLGRKKMVCFGNFGIQMTLQLTVKVGGQAGATGVLLESVGRSKKPSGRQELSGAGQVSIAETCLSKTETFKLTRLNEQKCTENECVLVFLTIGISFLMHACN